MVDDGPTCGKGLAEHGPLPEGLGELMAAVARILELHMETLDLGDESARTEHAAYAELSEAHRRIADDLRATAERMAGCRDLPMGAHDEAALSDPEHVDAFAEFVRSERELASLLRDRLERDREMLDAMEGDGS